MFMLTLATVGNPREQLREQLEFYANFIENSDKQLRNELFNVTDWDTSLYSYRFFQERLEKVVSVFESLLDRLDNAEEILRGIQPCKSLVRYAQYDQRFSRYVDLETYSTTAKTPCDQPTQNEITRVRNAFSTVFPLDNDSGRLTNRYGGMYYGNTSDHLAYPLINDDIDFEVQTNQFKSFREVIFAPMNISAEISNASIPLSRGVLFYQYNETDMQNDQQLTGYTCMELCQQVVRYIEHNQNEQQGRNVILYDETHFYPLQDGFEYGNGSRLIAWMQGIKVDNQELPAVEVVLQAVLAYVSSFQENQQRVFTQDEQPSSEPQLLLLQIILPLNTRIADYRLYQSVCERLSQISVESAVNVICSRHSLDQSQFTDRAAAEISEFENVSDIEGLLFAFTKLVQQRTQHTYALQHVAIGGDEYLLLGKRADEKILFFRVPLTYLTELACNCRLSAEIALLNNYDFHRIDSGSGSYLFSDIFYTLENREESYLQAKKRACTGSEGHVICKATIGALPQISAALVVNATSLPFAAALRSISADFRVSALNRSEYCYYLPHLPHRAANAARAGCREYIYPFPYNIDSKFPVGSDELYGGVLEPAQFAQLLDELFNYDTMEYAEFAAQKMIKYIGRTPEDRDFKIWQYLYAMAMKDRIAAYRDELARNITKTCAKCRAEPLQVCVFVGVDLIACAGDDVLSIRGVAGYYTRFLYTKRRESYSFTFDCRDLLEDYTSGQCQLLILRNSAEQRLMTYTFVITGYEDYSAGILLSIYPLFDQFDVPIGVFDIQSSEYQDIGGLPEKVALSYLLKYGVAGCYYDESSYYPQISPRVSEFIQQPKRVEELFLDDELYLFKTRDEKLYIMYLGSMEPTIEYACDKTKFNLLHDRNQTQRPTVRQDFAQSTFPNRAYIVQPTLQSLACTLFTFVVSATLSLLLMAI